MKQYELNDIKKAEKTKKEYEEVLEAKKMHEKFDQAYQEHQRKKSEIQAELQKEINRLMQRTTEIAQELDELWKLSHQIMVDMIIDLDKVVTVLVGDENKKQITFTMREVQQEIMLMKEARRGDSDPISGKSMLVQAHRNATKKACKGVGYTLTANDDAVLSKQFDLNADEIMLDKRNSDKHNILISYEKRKVDLISERTEAGSQIKQLKEIAGQIEPVVESAMAASKELGHLIVQWDDRLQHISNTDKQATVEKKHDASLHEKIAVSAAPSSEEAKISEKSKLVVKPEMLKSQEEPDVPKQTEENVASSTKKMLSMIVSNPALPKESLDKTSVSPLESAHPLAVPNPPTPAPAQATTYTKTEALDASLHDKPKASEPSKSVAQVGEIKTRRIGLAALRSQLAEKALVKTKDAKEANLDEKEKKDLPRPH